MSLSETKLSRDNADDGKDDAGRLQQYKNLTKHEELRRRRTECSVEIRKQKGADLMMKRRNIIDNEDDDLNECESENEDKDKLSNGNQMSNTNRLSNDEIKQILSSNPSEDDMIRCFESLRKSLSKTKNPPIDDVIQSGLINALVQALRVQNDRVQYEAAWALTNIVSGSTSQTMSAVEAGACAPLIELSCHSDGQIAEQALWAVANIAGDSAQLRDYVIECHGVEALMHIMSRIDQFTTSHVRTIAWAFSNMCRHKNPHAPLPVLKVLAKGLAVLVKHSDRQVRQDACWAVSYLTDGPDEQIELARESGVLSTIVSYLDESENLIAPALRTLGNVATGNDSLTQSVIDLGVLDRMVQLMEKTRSTSIMKECCWLISNIIAGTQKQIQQITHFSRVFSIFPSICGDMNISNASDDTIQMPQWFIDPNKIDCELVIKNKKEGFGGFYKKCTDKQGYMRVVFVHHATGAENAVKFLKCESCSSIIGDNGGHLQRHQKKHSTSGNSTSRNVLNASKLDVSRLLSRFFATTGRPLHEMENSSFRTLVGDLLNLGKRMDPTSVPMSLIPSRSSTRRYTLEKLDNEIAKLRTLVLPIAKSGYLSFMADFGRVHEDFLCLKASYLEERIDEDGSLKWVTLVVPIAYMSVSGDLKDANNIFIMIKQAVLNFFGEDLDLKTAFLTADGAHNIRRCATDHFNQYVRCFAHATDIIGKRTLLPYKSTIVSPLERSILKNYSDLLELCRLFTMSLKKDRALYKEIGVSLLDVVPTRWFSGFKCLVAVYKNIDKLGSFIAEMTPTSASHLDELLKIENRIRYKELSDVMDPLLQSNTYFQENSDSLKDVAVFVVSLMDEFDRFSVAGEKEVLVKFAKQATRKMCTDLDTIHFVATYLNPPSKDLHELQLRYDRHQIPIDIVNDAQKLLDDLGKSFEEMRYQAPPQSQPPARHLTFLQRTLGGSSAPKSSSLHQEQQQYERDTRSMPASKFWPLAKSSYPILHEIARKVHAIQASEADVERSFSIIKNLYTPNRQSLDLKMLEKLMIFKEKDRFDTGET